MLHWWEERLKMTDYGDHKNDLLFAIKKNIIKDKLLNKMLQRFSNNHAMKNSAGKSFTWSCWTGFLLRFLPCSPPLAVFKIGWSSEQPGLEEGVPIHGRVLDLNGLKGPCQYQPLYYFIFHTCNAVWGLACAGNCSANS